METRSQVLWRHAAACRREQGLSWPTFATTVREHYEAMTPESRRLICWNGAARDADRLMRDNAQTLRRFDADYEYRQSAHDIPADLEDAMVLAMAAHGYSRLEDLEAELAGRRGRVNYPALVSGEQHNMHHAAALMRESADVMDAIAKLMAKDGAITDRDELCDLEHARTQTLQAQGVLAGILDDIQQALERKGVPCVPRLRVAK